MADSVDSVAVTALVVALIALLATIGQLLGQYFATADGYRRCQSSVMGDWAQKTRLHWRWGQFRFETFYTAPEISLMEAWPYTPRDGEVLILGDKASRKLTMTPHEGVWAPVKEVETTASPSSSVRYHSDELVSWLPMLHWIHETTRASFESELLPCPKSQSDMTPEALLKWRRVPSLTMRERSWDFQPADVIQPLAKTTVSTIAILSRRMGMRWKDFRPADGIMRAEGHSHVITSMVVRGIGLVLQYNYTGRGQRLSRPSIWKSPALAGSVYREVLQCGHWNCSLQQEEEEIYIATSSADRLGAGVVRGHRGLGIKDYTIGTQQEIVTTLGTLDPSGLSAGALRKQLMEDPEFTFPVGDIVALTTHMIFQAGSPLVQVPAPSDNVRGVTTSLLGRRAFDDFLLGYIQDQGGPISPHDAVDWSKQEVGYRTCWVLWQMKTLTLKYEKHWGPFTHPSDTELWVVRRPVKYLEALNQYFDEATNYFVDGGCQDLERQTLAYSDILGAHIRVGIFGLADRNNSKAGPNHVGILLSKSYRDMIDDYFKALPEIVAYLHLHRVSRKLVVDAWVMMMFRAFCWGACHFFVPGERVPRAYFGSQLPVYIG